MIMASQAYKDNGAIFIWNDETEGETALTADQFDSMEILLSPLAVGNAYNSTLAYNHSSDLRTMQEIFGLTGSWLGGAADARDLSGLFRTGAVPAVPEPATWSMLLLGFGAIGIALRRGRKNSTSLAGA